MGGREVHVNAVSPWVDLEPFRVDGQGDVPNFLPGKSVERGEPSASVADHQPPRSVGADIVSVVTTLDRGRR